MLASSDSNWPCCCMAVVVVVTASHAVAVTEQSATRMDTTSRRTRRLEYQGTRCLTAVTLWGTAASGWIAELVAHSVDGEQVGRPGGAPLDLLAQVHHVHVDGALGDVAVESPGQLEQRLSGEDPARLSGQGGEQQELTRRAVHEPFAYPHLMAADVDGQRAHPQHPALRRLRCRRRCLRPPQQGTDPRHELARAVGLGQVVVGADVEAEQQVVLGRPGGQHQHRQGAFRPQRPADLQSSIGTFLIGYTERLERLNQDLARSNEELDAFAYAAAHDLKEPLRGISNYARARDPGLARLTAGAVCPGY